MKKLNKRVLGVFATVGSAVLAMAAEPGDMPKKSEADGSTEKTQGYAAVNGLKMYYEIHGAGKPLVLLHGAFGFATVYPNLAKNRQVIAVELQGHGHTADIDSRAVITFCSGRAPGRCSRRLRHFSTMSERQAAGDGRRPAGADQCEPHLGIGWCQRWRSRHAPIS